MDVEKKTNSVTVDDILTILGPFGKFNVVSFLLILCPVFMAGMYASVYNFETMDLKYRCRVPECTEDPQYINYTIPHDRNGEPAKCLRYAPFTNLTSDVTDNVNFTNGINGISDGSDTNMSQCSPLHFDTSTEIKCDYYVYLEEHSIVKEFDLGCKDWKRTLVGTVHNAGFFIAIPLTGLISDKYGRRPMIVIASVANGVFGLIRALSVNYEMFVVFEFLEPAFGGGVYTACFVLALELVGPKGRVLVSLLFNTMFILGGVTVTLLSWSLQSWRYLLFIIYSPSVFVFIYIWILTESFRWLFSKGRYVEAIDVLLKSEKMNHVNVPKEHYEQVEKQATKQRDDRKCQNAERNESTFKQMLTSAMIWKRLFVCSFLWISSTLVYYGLSINAIELSGNSYVNYIVILVIEAPANVCKLIFLDKFGRKRVIAIAYCLTALILISYAFVPAGNWSILLYLGGKFFITLAYNSLYVFAAEVFPTNYRTTLLAMCSTIGRIGSTVAPQTPLLTKFYIYLPTMIFGGMAAVSGLLVLTLPETNNMKLPDSLEEAEDQDKRGTPQESEERPANSKTRL